MKSVLCQHLLGCFLILPLAAFGGSKLPRRANAPAEDYPNVDVIYDSVAGPSGERLRTILTKPRGSTAKLPVIFVAGWLSCDSVEAPNSTNDAAALVLRGLAQLKDFCTFRVDKPGVGDSDGNCADTDFETELAGYRVAFHSLTNYPFIDLDRVYLLGISNGGGFAPLVPESELERVRGFIVVGGWVKTWFEHMLEIERRRFALSGKTPGDVNERMKRAAILYHDWLIDGRRVGEIIRQHPELAGIWPEGADHDHLYGRPLTFYEQLQKLNLAATWARVKASSLILHGQFDWIMSRDDHEMIAQYVNANTPGAARFMEVPEMGHTFQHYRSMQDAFAGKSAPFDPKMIELVAGWLREQLNKT